MHRKSKHKSSGIMAFRRGKTLFSVKTCNRVKKSSVGRIVSIPKRCQQ